METHAHLRAFCFEEKYMQSKEFKTVDEQLEILRSRGLKIVNDEKRKRIFT